MSMDLALSELAELFAVLGHPHRIRILQELRGGERDVASLVAALGASQSRTSQHLGLLKAHHLVHAHRKGRQVFYELRDPAVADWIVAALPFVATSGESRRLDASIAEVAATFGGST
jgi:DNA-binding transcriptional ArsR family regulator